MVSQVGPSQLGAGYSQVLPAQPQVTLAWCAVVCSELCAVLEFTHL